MKKLLLIVLALSLVAGCGVRKALADEVNVPNLLSKIPALNQAVIFSISDSKWDYASTVTVKKFLKDDKIKIDVGYTPKQELIGLVSVKVMSAKDYITFPVLDKVEIEPFIYAGSKRLGVTEGNNEWDWGCGVKIIQAKF